MAEVSAFREAENIDDLMCLQIDENRSERASTLEREIIDSKLDDWSGRPGGQGHDAPENGELAGLDAHAIRHTHTQSAAGRQANDLDQLKESCRHTC